MPHTLSDAYVAAAYGQSSGVVVATLLKIQSQDNPGDTQYWTDQHTIINHGTSDYQPAPFQCIIPDDQRSKIPAGRLQLENVSREIIFWLRALEKSPLFDITLVLTTSPDIIEREFLDMTITKASYNLERIEVAPTYEDIFLLGYPDVEFIPAYFNALAKAY